MQTLASYLRQRMPIGMSYPDAAQLCLRLYCIADGVPDDLQPPLTRLALADTFAELAGVGWIHDRDSVLIGLYGANFHAVTDKGHWIEVIASIYKKGDDVVDIVRGEELARQVGLVGKRDERL